MSIKDRKLAKIDAQIQSVYQKEQLYASGGKWLFWKLRRYIHMLQHEFLKNDVPIRAESLSYFTLFSILPLMAGVFLILSFFSQWGPIQNEFETFLKRILGAIPDEERETLLQYLLQFKDQYIAKLSAKSTSIGIFAVGVLVWIGAKVYFNIEALMNRIWGVKEERSWFDRIQNFVFCLVILPVSYAVALSLPGIIEHFGQKNVGLLLNQVIPAIIGFLSMSFILRYFPNTRVSWRSAQMGALATMLGFWVSGFFLAIYFRVGTETAYGKAAVLPIFAFFIYVSWILFILGVEVSLILEKGERIVGKRVPATPFGETLLLEKLIRFLQLRFQSGDGPASLRTLGKELDIHPDSVERVVEFLLHKGVLVEGHLQLDAESENKVGLAREVSETDLLNLIKDHLDLTLLAQRFDVKNLISRLNQS